MLKNGDRVRDRISGLEGIVVGEHQWMFGCRRLSVQPDKLHEGKPIDNVTFDEPQLVLMQSAAFTPAAVEQAPAVASSVPAARPGGPRNERATQRP